MVRWSRGSLPLALALAGCRDAVRSLGPEPAVLRRNASQLFGAMIARYNRPARDAKYEVARLRLAKASVVPSRAFNDTVIWTSAPSPATRRLGVHGASAPGHYQFVAVVDPPRPVALAESRHIIDLTRLGGSDYLWTAEVDMSLGSARAGIVGDLATALLASPEGRRGPILQVDYRSVAPRTTAVMRELLALDSITTTNFSDGSTLATLHVGIDPDRLRARYPAFATYIANYVDPARWRLRLMDRDNVLWFEARAEKRRLFVRYRSRAGQLVPTFGATRPRPDTMELHVDFTTKISLFTIGMRDLTSEIVFTSTPGERAWTIRSRKEPAWDFPLITERLLRSPLRRPFEGDGVYFRLGVRDSAGVPTLLERETRVAMRESAIVRFIGSLGARAVSDLSELAERDEERFLHDIFEALDADAAALATPDATMHVPGAGGVDSADTPGVQSTGMPGLQRKESPGLQSKETGGG